MAKSPDTPRFNEAADAYAKVKAAADALRADHDAVCLEIEAAQKELDALPLLTVPPEDLKAGILDFVDASGRRYGADKVRAAISAFAKGYMAGAGGADRLGKPLRYCDIEGAIAGTSAEMGWAQILTPDKSQFNDQVIYCFFAELVREGLRRVMADMTPAELGYDAIHPDKIGTDRAARRAAIDALQARLADLHDRKADLAGKLRALGHLVKGI